MTPLTIDIQLYEALRQKLGNAEAEAFVGLVEAKIRSKEDRDLKMLTTKADLSLLKEDVKELEGMVKDVKNELKQDLAEVRFEVQQSLASLISKISETKSENNRWMFGFFIVFILALLGLYAKK
jgi:uncharacterized FlaG/YvyC family protein